MDALSFLLQVLAQTLSIPPLGGIDLSAILAFIALQLVQSLLKGASVSVLGSGY